MRILAIAFVISAIAISSASASLISGIANTATNTTASGTIEGIGWTATSTSTSPFLGVNIGSGVWDVGTALPTNALFLGTSSVNGGDSQAFFFNAPVSDIYFYVENFDSGSIANISTDDNLSLFGSSSSISLTSTGNSNATLSSSNTSYNGEGDAILLLSGPASFVQFDYLQGDGANGIFYGFATDVAATAVPEPSSFLCLAISASVFYCFRRRQLLKES